MAGKGRDAEVRNFDRLIKHLVVEDFPPDHPLCNLPLLEQFIQRVNPHLTLKNIAPDLAGHSFGEQGKPSPQAYRYLLYRSLRAKVLFDFAGEVCRINADRIHLAGTVILALRWQVDKAGLTPTSFLTISACKRALADNANRANKFTQILWDIFQSDFNGLLPLKDRLATLAKLPGAEIFTGSTTTSLTSYQDVALEAILAELKAIAPDLRFEPIGAGTPDEPEIGEPTGPASDFPAAESAADTPLSELASSASLSAAPQSEAQSVPVSLEEEAGARGPTPCSPLPAPISDTSSPELASPNDLNTPTPSETQSGLEVEETAQVMALRDFIVSQTRYPQPFHPLALEICLPFSVPNLSRLRIVGHPFKDPFPLDQLILTPIFQRVAATKERLILEPHEYSLDELMAMGKAIFVGGPGAGKTTALMQMAQRVNTAEDSAPRLMLVVSAVRYAQYATSLRLSHFAAQELLDGSFHTDQTLDELANGLERLSRSGRLIWGIDDFNYEIGPEANALLTELLKGDAFILCLTTLRQAAIRKVQATLGNTDNTFALRRLDESQQRRYQEQYAQQALAHYPQTEAAGDLAEAEIIQLRLRRLATSIAAATDLTETPLGLAAVCLIAENYWLQDAAQLCLAERFHRAGIFPQSLLARTTERPVVLRALLHIARMYWQTEATLEITAPIKETTLVSWLSKLAPWPATANVIKLILSTRLIVPAYGNEDYIFAQQSLYEFLLATALLEEESRGYRGMPRWQEVPKVFEGLPDTLIRRISDLASARESN